MKKWIVNIANTVRLFIVRHFTALLMPAQDGIVFMKKTKKKHLCYKCPFLMKAYSKDLEKVVFACTYISKTTAWSCVEDESDIDFEKEIL